MGQRWRRLLAEIQIDEQQTAALGGQPAASDTRVYIHTQLAALGLAQLGLRAAPKKIVVGDPLVGLGLSVSTVRDTLACPEQKRISMLADIADQHAAALELEVDCTAARTLVGRLCNLSQIYPELRPLLHGGYAVTRATWRVHGRWHSPRRLTLAAGGKAQSDWCELLGVAAELLDENRGVPLAPRLDFPTASETGILVSTTDAAHDESGSDGVGGYVFDARLPGAVVLVSEPWPADVRAALDFAKLPRAERAGREDGMLSMPAAELFGIWAVPLAAAAATGLATEGVIAIGDCDAAAAATNAASSGKPQMRALLRSMRAECAQWLAVSVSRDDNLDADRLSHHELLGEVRADAEAAGLRVVDAPIPGECWEALREALELRCDEARSTRQRRKRRRAPASGR